MTCTCLYNHTATGPRSIHQADARCPEHGGKRMTTAEVFADYLGLTPENAPWAWTRHEDRKGNELFEPTLTATSPLAPEPTPGWAGALLRYSLFNLIQAHWHKDGRHYEACTAPECELYDAMTPEAAMAKAMIAADPTLREACERAEEEFKL